MQSNLHDADRRAIAAMAHAASTAGFVLDTASVRRTSSRLCLSVEHGDYNGTELFGVSVDRFIWCAYRGTDSRSVRLFSASFAHEGLVEFTLNELPPPRSPSINGTWARFPLGVAHVLQESGIPLTRGIEGVIYSEIPGGGMSRSASLSINLILALLDVNGRVMDDRLRVAELAQAVENRYIGSPCGIMDQVMILFGRAGTGTLFDPSRQEVSHVALPESAADFRFVMLDTGTARPGLEESTYRIRRQECDELVRLLNRAGLAVRTLAEVSSDQYAAIQCGVISVPPRLLPRLTYLHEAQLRFPRLLDAWRRGDMRTVGGIFRHDGIGLRDDYQVSGPELEAMCDIARTVPGVWGERMLGGGDKGASGAVVRADAIPALRDAVGRQYPARCPSYADLWSIHELSLVDGVAMVEGGMGRP